MSGKYFRKVVSVICRHELASKAMSSAVIYYYILPVFIFFPIFDQQQKKQLLLMSSYFLLLSLMLLLRHWGVYKYICTFYVTSRGWGCWRRGVYDRKLTC